MDYNTEYSKEALDILGKVPNVVVRYGLLTFFSILIGVVLFLSQFKYSDSMQMTIKKLTNSSYIYISEIAEEDKHTIEIGQKVSVSFKDYSKGHYGTWEGTIKNISIPTDAIFYKVEIELLPCANSTKGYQLPTAQPSIYGTAEYSGETISFFERIFEHM